MGARLEPESTPNMATTRARPMTAADSHAAFRHIPLSFQRARIWSTSHKPTALRVSLYSGAATLSLPPSKRRTRSGKFSPESPARLHRAVNVVGDRSEEHTSELQSLMRISYAVFCLKKKT